LLVIKNQQPKEEIVTKKIEWMREGEASRIRARHERHQRKKKKIRRKKEEREKR